MENLSRHIGPVVARAVAAARVVVLNGARQSGKTTLLRALHAQMGGTFTTLDHPAELRAARLDPRSRGRGADGATR